MNKEIERKYSIKNLPDNLLITKIIDIEQTYVWIDNNTIIRIRKVLDRKEEKTQYIYTIKTKGDIQNGDNQNICQKYEIESNISEKEYEELKQKKISNFINKTRIIAPIEDELKVEIDIYYDYLEGFLTAEIEFPNELSAENFNKPDWLGEELGYKEFSNGKLARMTKEELESKVSTQFMQNNKDIISKLKQKISFSY